MDVQTLSLDEIEALNVRFSDEFALKRGWNEHYMTNPEDDLNLFFRYAPGSRMLDVGCGWARYVQLFLDQGLEYVGIDHSLEMLNVAREQFPKLRFEHGSYRDMKLFADGTFDALWCCCVFGGEPKHNMPNVLQELKRVLVDGGIMTVIMPLIHESDEYLATSKNGDPVFWHAFYDLSELQNVLKEGGFEVVEAFVRFDSGAMSVLVRK